MTVVPGSRLGPYEIVAPIGAGGMGEVFRARDTRLERNVAIKILPAALAHDLHFRTRFEREAKTISQLNHPHICQIYDVGEAVPDETSSGHRPAVHQDHRSDGGARGAHPSPAVSYLVMELLEGESLADRLARGALPLPDVLRYGAQIAEALAAAHRAGIVHRDLKPGNVMITKSGAKLLDFGLAKAADGAAPIQFDGTGATEHRPLTAQGTILGTFQYMAPEQLEGEEADPRTDIFALGSLLYEMLTGQRAFEGKSKTSLIAAIVSGTPRPASELQPIAPPALEHVITRCLAKERDDRWRSAHDVAEELKWISGAGSRAGVSAPLIAGKKSRERLAWLAALVATAVAAAGVTYVRTKQPPAPRYRFTVPMIDTGYKAGRSPLISPDGTQVLFSAQNTAGVKQLFIRRLDTFEARALPGTDDMDHMCWSHDSRSILLYSDSERKLRRMDVDGGGAPEVIAEIPAIQDAAWSRTGDIIVAQYEGPLLLLDRDGGKPRPVSNPDPGRFERGHVSVHFLPDGKQFLFTTFTRNPADPNALKSLYAGSLDSPEIRRISDIPSRVMYARGQLFFARDGSLFAQPFDLGSLKLTGTPVKVVDDVEYFQPPGYANFTVSNDGTVVTQANPRPHQLTITDAKGIPLGTIGEPGFFSRGDLSRDGSRLFVGREDQNIGTHDIWEYGTTRETASRMTFDAAWESRPAISPGAARLYYQSDAKGLPDLYVRSIDGTEKDRLLLAEPGEQDANDVSADDKYLLYSDDRMGNSDLWLLPLMAGKPTPFVQGRANEGGGRFSPDGVWVSYTGDASGRSELYVKRFLTPASPQQVSTRGAWAARWSGDGRTLYFLSIDRRTIFAVAVEDGRIGEPAPVFTWSSAIYTFEVFPDGRFLLWSIDDDADAPPARVIVRWPDTVNR